jgi:hypothetical protein
MKCGEVKWREGRLNMVRSEVVKWREVNVLVKCICITSCSYAFHYCIVCQIVINADSSTLGSLLGLNTHFVF